MLTDKDGNSIWRRGGRVEKLPLKFGREDTAVGALKEAAKKLRESAEWHQSLANTHGRWAAEKLEQAAEIESDVQKLEAK